MKTRGAPQLQRKLPSGLTVVCARFTVPGIELSRLQGANRRRLPLDRRQDDSPGTR
jgi:hypothetical protein